MSTSQLGTEPAIPAPRGGDERLTTPFEDWCERTGTHPEAPGAWECFAQNPA